MLPATVPSCTPRQDAAPRSSRPLQALQVALFGLAILALAAQPGAAAGSRSILESSPAPEKGEETCRVAVGLAAQLAGCLGRLQLSAAANPPPLPTAAEAPKTLFGDHLADAKEDVCEAKGKGARAIPRALQPWRPSIDPPWGPPAPRGPPRSRGLNHDLWGSWIELVVIAAFGQLRARAGLTESHLPAASLASPRVPCRRLDAVRPRR
jgi:hypothetical protein